MASPAPSPNMQSLNVIDLGRMPYANAFDQQRAIHAQVVAGELTPTLLLVEHNPVITISRRKAAPQHLIADKNRLERLGIDVQPTDRGGDITYHGPGQLVAYPIVNLNALRLNVGRYMRTLEQLIIDTLAAFDVVGRQSDAGTGVWVEGKAESGQRKSDEKGREAETGEHTNRINSSDLAKIAAIGVRISRGVSMHGLAINVTTELAHFDTIVPCGLAGRSVTSLQRLQGDAAPSLADVKRELIVHANAQLTVH